MATCNLMNDFCDRRKAKDECHLINYKDGIQTLLSRTQRSDELSFIKKSTISFRTPRSRRLLSSSQSVFSEQPTHFTPNRSISRENNKKLQCFARRLIGGYINILIYPLLIYFTINILILLLFI